jgi:hypothetical protein
VKSIIRMLEAPHLLPAESASWHAVCWCVVFDYLTGDDIQSPSSCSRGPRRRSLKLYPVSSDAEVAAAQKAASRARVRVQVDLWAVNQLKSSKRICTYYFRLKK